MKMIRGLQNALLPLLLLVTSISYAGGMEGGGAKGVVCRDIKGAIKSAELLDLWEARVIYKREVKHPEESLSEQVSQAIEALKYSIDSGSMTFNGKYYSPSEYVAYSLRATADLFLNQGPSVERLHSVVLADVPDSFEAAMPQDCKIEQIINFMDSSTHPLILVNQDIVDKMDITNQAALIAHEAYYALLRSYSHETNSIRTRRAIGFVFAGNNFISIGSIEATDVFICDSPPEDQNNYSLLYFYLNTDKDLNILQSHSFGSIHVGVGSGRPLLPKQSLQDMYELFCKNPDQVTSMAIPGEMPVDFQRINYLVLTCQDRKLNFYLSKVQASTVVPNGSIRLNCMPTKSLSRY